MKVLIAIAICTWASNAMASGSLPMSSEAAAETACTAETTAKSIAQVAFDKCSVAAKATDPRVDLSIACKKESTTLADAKTKESACTDKQPASKATTDAISTQVSAIQTALDSQKDSDFELELGIGSLLRNGDDTDYTNNANTLAATSLGSATPQYLLGVAMRSPIPNIKPFQPDPLMCQAADRLARGDDLDDPKQKAVDLVKAELCPSWRRKPWSGFVSLKFSSSASQTINGYVIGGAYRAMHYMNILVGFSLTPVNEPSHGLRVTASQYVSTQQKLGLLQNFDPVAMLDNSYNAFDGFSLADPTGKLIYSGTPLEVHYRGGATIGVSIPINFANFLKGN